ncbi:hypothetical protein L1887_04573 [Cichorium endivia]|nr:hypothetical protein L1887_04573 [Cichorium endivia]
MELSEEYTRLISHGPNPKTTHIYDNCVVESCCGVIGTPELKKPGPPKPSCENFLSICHTCTKNLEEDAYSVSFFPSNPLIFRHLYCLRFCSYPTSPSMTHKVLKLRGCIRLSISSSISWIALCLLVMKTVHLLGTWHLSTCTDPLGIQGRKVRVSGTDACLQVWAGPLSGTRFAVVLWNRCSEAGTINVSWDSLGLQSSVSVSVRDLWKFRP